MSAIESDVAGDRERLVWLSRYQPWELTADRFLCYDCSRIHDIDSILEEFVDPDIRPHGPPNEGAGDVRSDVP